MYLHVMFGIAVLMAFFIIVVKAGTMPEGTTLDDVLNDMSEESPIFVWAVKYFFPAYIVFQLYIYGLPLMMDLVVFMYGG